MSASWRVWLIVWCVGIFIFGAVLAGGAFEATSGPVRLVYEALQGRGPLNFDPAMRFSLGVMGGISIGWAMTMLLGIRAAIELGDRARPVWVALTLGLATWFVIDSTLSIATGFGMNVIPNIALIAGYLAAVFASGRLKKPAA